MVSCTRAINAAHRHTGHTQADAGTDEGSRVDDSASVRACIVTSELEERAGHADDEPSGDAASGGRIATTRCRQDADSNRAV